jgi:hypothetical protein
MVQGLLTVTPPVRGPVNPKSEASCLAVVFSIIVKDGDVLNTCTWSNLSEAPENNLKGIMGVMNNHSEG